MPEPVGPFAKGRERSITAGSRQGASSEAVAIVGLHGRFPGARDLNVFWRNLRDGVESITFLTESELRAAGVDSASVDDPGYVRACRVLEGAEEFDAGFFGYSPREAELMDPQHRLFLEGAWSALENAGYAPGNHRGEIAVYAGLGFNSYLMNNVLATHGRRLVTEDLATLLGSDKDFLATRASYHLDLTGPSIVVQTGCSTSLVAVAMAFEALSSRQCDMALAGGVSVRAPQRCGYKYVREGILSPDGHCRPFDARAQGTSMGSGLGIVVLKRLADAISDGDSIRAVIRGAAVNNDGSRKVGYTAPSVERQANVISMAQAVAGVPPETISYVEAHGTGTILGDPIEVAALKEAFQAAGGRKGFCALGSVKGNVGHLDAASGIAGMIKTVLALEHGMIPPTLHFRDANSEIDFNSGPFFVNNELREWRTNGMPRRAGISSFGMGGTNAHVVLEEAPAPPRSTVSRPSQLFVLSAKTDAALGEMTANLAAHLRANPDLDLADVAYTLQVGRKAFDHRRAFTCSELEEALRLLESSNVEATTTRVAATPERPICFLFPGQGAQHVEMGRGLYRSEPLFRDQVDASCERLRPLLGVELRDVLFPTEGQRDAAAERLTQTFLAQPALFVIEHALARLWMEWGVQPQAMIGHSVGELVAACLAGVFHYEDALKLVALRARLIQDLPRGAMLAVPLRRQDIEPRLGPGLSLAAVNAPAMCTVSGPSPAIDRLEGELLREGRSCRRLDVSHAFHSSMMEPAMARFAEEVGRVARHPPLVDFVSNVTGTWIAAQEATDPAYWASQLRRTVRFSEGIETLLSEPAQVMLEVGPGTALTAFVQSRLEEGSRQVAVASMRHARDGRADLSVLQSALGQLWLSGVPIDWTAFHQNERRRRVPLPTYPFARERHWIEAVDAVGSESARFEEPSRWFYVPSWQRNVCRRADGTERKSKGPWLMLADDSPVWQPLVRTLVEDSRVVIVHASDRFARLASDRFALDPANRAHYERLLAELGPEDIPTRVVHLWLAAAEALSPGDALSRGFFAVNHLVDALVTGQTRGQLDVTVVTRGAQEVMGDDIRPERATVLGAGRVVPQERPQVRVRCVDFDGVAIESGSEGLLRLVEQEITASDSEPIVAYRGGHRWVPRFEAVELPRRAGIGSLREKGVYLITGGLGGIGLTLAEFLAKEVAARLVLCSRTGLPPRAEWDAILESGTGQSVDAIRKVRELESLGAEVLVFAANVADRDAMQRVVEVTRRTFGRLNGVIHAAGVPGGNLLRAAEQPVSGAALEAKVAGTLVLEEVCGAEPDFIVLCSALSSVLGGLGQSDYCAGNAFLDAFAIHRRTRRSPRVVSVGWDTWSEVGMAVDAEVPATLRQRQEQILKEGLTREEGVEVFRRILESPYPHVLVSTGPIDRRWPERESRASSLDSGSRDVEADVVPQSEVEQTVTRLWRQLLGVAHSSPDDSFFQQGGNSLLATQLLARLQERYPEATISLRGFFDRPTIAALVQAIEALEPSSTDAPEEAIVQRLLETAPDDRPGLIRTYLEQQVAEAVGVPPHELRGHSNLERFDQPLIAAHLTSALDRDLALRIYPHEVRARPSIDALTQFVEEELARSSAHEASTLPMQASEPQVAASPRLTVRPAPEDAETKNESMAFLLSAPRTGSTLLRVMLSGHPALFCPPELFLLDHEGMDAWSRDPFSEFYRDGLVRAFMGLREIDFEEARAVVEDLVAQDTPVQAVYRLLQPSNGRLLVDKTPTYALSMSALHRAERLFREPRFVVLVRHPYAMIDSFVRNRLARIRRVEGEPYAVAENCWIQTYQNLTEFAKRLDGQRCHVVRFEDLVQEPATVMLGLSRFLGVSFEDVVLDPYGQGRMLGGPGDPNLFRRGAIDASLGEAWRSVVLPRPLSDACARLASTFGYDLAQG